MNYKIWLFLFIQFFLQNGEAKSSYLDCGEYQLQGYIRKNINTPHVFVFHLYEKSNSEIELPVSSSGIIKILPYQDSFVTIKATISYESNLKKLAINNIESISRTPLNYLDINDNPTIKLIRNRR